MKLNPPCKNCKDRQIEPVNCHNPDICSKWSEYQKELSVVNESRKEDVKKRHDIYLSHLSMVRNK